LIFWSFTKGSWENVKSTACYNKIKKYVFYAF
jgi:hypothetical protein